MRLAGTGRLRAFDLIRSVGGSVAVKSRLDINPVAELCLRGQDALSVTQFSMVRMETPSTSATSSLDSGLKALKVVMLDSKSSGPRSMERGLSVHAQPREGGLNGCRSTVDLARGLVAIWWQIMASHRFFLVNQSHVAVANANPMH
jgi:hypothetical protein